MFLLRVAIAQVDKPENACALMDTAKYGPRRTGEYIGYAALVCFS
jgi:hypothetical protein